MERKAPYPIERIHALLGRAPYNAPMIQYKNSVGLFYLLVALAVACASPAARAHNIAAGASATHSVSADTADLVLQALGLIGTRYKFGGTSPDVGFDCSGFVRHLFDTTLGRVLPRTSLEMSRLGDKIDRPSLLPGDLVFYNTRRKSFSHVGLYIGEGRFIHAPSKGRAVEIVDMSDRYWVPRFNGARRLLAAFMGPPEPESPNENAASN